MHLHEDIEKKHKAIETSKDTPQIRSIEKYLKEIDREQIIKAAVMCQA